ncbi:hypothetical protein NDU88_000967, partial [Pleurodeles waltl]
ALEGKKKYLNNAGSSKWALFKWNQPVLGPCSTDRIGNNARPAVPNYESVMTSGHQPNK